MNLRNFKLKTKLMKKKTAQEKGRRKRGDVSSSILLSPRIKNHRRELIQFASLVINTATTIVTFLMVFLIQRAQNKDAAVIQLKLNEVLAALEGASNQLINVEDLSEEDVRDLHKRYQRLMEKACCKGEVRAGHSVEEVKGGKPNGRGAGI